MSDTQDNGTVDTNDPAAAAKPALDGDAIVQTARGAAAALFKGSFKQFEHQIADLVKNNAPNLPDMPANTEVQNQMNQLTIDMMKQLERQLDQIYPEGKKDGGKS